MNESSPNTRMKTGQMLERLIKFTYYHYRDKNGLECDAVIHLRNGSYGLVEIKLGGDKLIDMAVTKSANVNVRIQENIKQQAEQILETIGISRATAIDMFYRQIILNKGIPFSLTIPKSLPAQADMDEKTFNALMSKGYDQAVHGDSYPIDDVFEELER